MPKLALNKHTMSKEIEEWRPVVGYEGLYEVSDWGNVRSVDRIVIRRTRWNKTISKKYKGTLLSLINGRYYKVELNNVIASKKLVHRLVAEAFIPNPNNLPIVGHLDCNTHNNSVENLYWCTQYENNNHPITKKRRSLSKMKPLDQIDEITGEVVNSFESVKEARNNGFHHASDVANGKRKQDKGFLFKFCTFS